MRIPVYDFGTCLSFNGTSAYTSNPIGTGISTYTVSLWANPTALKTGAAPFCDSVNSSIYIQMGGGSNPWQIPAGPSTTIPTLNQWVHLVLVQTSTTQYLYINGVLAISGASTSTLSSTINFGRRSDGVYFPGSIDESSIYNTALSASQVAQLYNNLGTISNAGLVGYWKMDEGTGLSLIDSSGSGNTGTITAGVYSSNVRSKARSAVYDFGTSLSFNGTSSEIAVPTLPHNTNSFTLSGWTYLTLNNTSANQALYANILNVRLLIGSGTGTYSGAYAGVWIGGTEYSMGLSANVAPSNYGQWVHWALVRSGNTMTLYRNGFLVAITNTFPTGNNDGLTGYVGSYYNAYFFTGNLDEVSLYDSSSTLAQVQSLYLNKGTISGKTPLFYYKMDEGTGTTAIDSSGNGNNGTITSATYSNNVAQKSRPSVYDFGTSLLLNAAGNKATLTAIPTGANYTLNAWFNASSLGSSYMAIFSESAANKGLYFNATTKKVALYLPTGMISTQTYSLNQWYMVTAVVTGTTETLYVNGNPVVTGVAGSSMNLNTIGTDSAAEQFYGNLDEMSVYQSSLSVSQIQQLFLNKGTIANASLASYWKANEGSGTTLIDSSGLGNNGAISGATYSTAVVNRARPSVYDFGTCQLFNGTTSGSIPTSTNLSIAGDISVSAWFHKDTIDSIKMIVRKGTLNTYLFYFETGNAGGVLYWQFYDGTTYRPYQATFRSNPGQWVHGVVTFSPSAGIIKFYANGVLIGTTTGITYTPYLNTTDPLQIGNGLVGGIDELSIYNSVISASQVQGLYLNKGTVSGLTPVGYWKFDEGVGTVLVDSSGNNNNGTTTATYSTNVVQRARPAVYDFGTSLSFPGSANYITTPLALGTQTQMSINIWAQFPVVATTPAMWGSAGANSLILRYSGNALQFFINSSGALTSFASIPNFLGLWKMYTITHHFTAQVTNLYIDGVLFGSNSNTTPWGATPGNFQLGGRGVTVNPWDGLLDEASFYNTILTASQVKTLYLNKGSISGAGLVGYWKMDEGTGTTTADSSGNGNTGTLSGTSWSTNIAG